MMILTILIIIVLGYLLGNLNGAIIASHILGDDVRNHGSGNAGLTNFIRSYGVRHCMLVILVDAGKALIACLIGGILGSTNALSYHSGVAIGGTAVMLGHIFPVFYGFRGGKGILSGLFIALLLDWRIGLLILAIFAVLYFSTHYVSLSSVIAALVFSVCFGVMHTDNLIIAGCGVFMGLLAAVMHWQNILRLLNGTEKKTNFFERK